MAPTETSLTPRSLRISATAEVKVGRSSGVCPGKRPYRPAASSVATAPSPACLFNSSWISRLTSPPGTKRPDGPVNSRKPTGPPGSPERRISSAMLASPGPPGRGPPGNSRGKGAKVSASLAAASPSLRPATLKAVAPSSASLITAGLRRPCSDKSPKAVAKAGRSDGATREITGCPIKSSPARPKRARKAPSAKEIWPRRSVSTNNSAAAKAKTTKRSLLWRDEAGCCNGTALSILPSGGGKSKGPPKD